MSGEPQDEHYMFIIFYETEVLELKLLGTATVEDVKLHIYEKFKVRPSKQIITGWESHPADDDQTLTSLMLPNQNALWVLSTDNRSEIVAETSSSINSYPEVSIMIRDTNVEENATEVEACVSFVAQFLQVHGDTHPPFHSCTLEEAISATCFAPVQSRKIIALYFHNGNDPFSKTFCTSLANADIRNILENTYFLLAWDVSDKIYHSALKKSLDKNIDFELAQEMLAGKQAALFIVYPIENSITIFSMLQGSKVKGRDILTALQEIERNFQNEIKNEMELEEIREQSQTQNDIGPKEFQQLMFDRLGDRDYDCFEYDEHEHLKDKIGFSKFGPPQDEKGYDKKQKKKIEETYKQVRLQSNKYAEQQDQIVASFIYNCLEPMPEEKIARAKKYPDYNPNTDLSPIPVYVIRKCRGSENPCRIFIDNDDRVYNSWKDFIEDNKLHKCTMVLPQGGRYAGDDNDEVLLERHLSPACGIGHNVLKGADITVTVAGLASGGIFIAAMIPTIAVAPVALAVAAGTGIAVGAYSMIRSAVDIYDRKVHGESMSFANSDARGAYINIVAGSLGFVGMGATTALSQFAAKGVNIGQGGRAMVNTITAANLAASGVSVANSTYKVIDDYITDQRSPSLLSIVQLSSSILFFGNAVYNFKMAGTIIEETQSSALQNYQKSLRSNRHRKVFNKMMKETVHQNNGDVRAANAEVISTIHNIRNKDEVFAILTRNNKLFNEEGIRFSAENGEIKLNGMSVDLFEFGTMTKAERSQLLVELPPTSVPQPSPGNPSTKTIQTLGIIQKVFDMENVATFVRYGQLISTGCSFAQLAESLLRDFSADVQEKIMRICKALLDNLCGGSMDFRKVSADYFSSMEPQAVALKFVIDFLQVKTNNDSARYEEEKELAKQLPGYNEGEFNQNWGVLPQTGKNALDWVKRLVDIFVVGSSIDQVLLRELIQYVMNVVTEKIYEHCNEEEKRNRREANTARHQHKISCKVCGGYYYSKEGPS